MTLLTMIVLIFTFKVPFSPITHNTSVCIPPLITPLYAFRWFNSTFMSFYMLDLKYIKSRAHKWKKEYLCFLDWLNSTHMTVSICVCFPKKDIRLHSLFLKNFHWAYKPHFPYPIPRWKDTLIWLYSIATMKRAVITHASKYFCDILTWSLLGK